MFWDIYLSPSLWLIVGINVLQVAVRQLLLISLYSLLVIPSTPSTLVSLIFLTQMLAFISLVSSLHFQCLLDNSTVMSHKHFKLSTITRLLSVPLPVPGTSTNGTTTILPVTQAWNLPDICDVLLGYPSAFWFSFHLAHSLMSLLSAHLKCQKPEQ